MLIASLEHEVASIIHEAKPSNHLVICIVNATAHNTLFARFLKLPFCLQKPQKAQCQMFKTVADISLDKPHFRGRLRLDLLLGGLFLSFKIPPPFCF